jgi:hypothetical protein
MASVSRSGNSKASIIATWSGNTMAIDHNNTPVMVPPWLNAPINGTIPATTTEAASSPNPEPSNRRGGMEYDQEIASAATPSKAVGTFIKAMATAAPRARALATHAERSATIGGSRPPTSTPLPPEKTVRRTIARSGSTSAYSFTKWAVTCAAVTSNWPSP